MRVKKQREVWEKMEKDGEVVKKWQKNEPEAQVQQQKQKKPPKTPPKNAGRNVSKNKPKKKVVSARKSSKKESGQKKRQRKAKQIASTPPSLILLDIMKFSKISTENSQNQHC